MTDYQNKYGMKKKTQLLIQFKFYLVCLLTKSITVLFTMFKFHFADTVRSLVI